MLILILFLLLRLPLYFQIHHLARNLSRIITKSNSLFNPMLAYYCLCFFAAHFYFPDSFTHDKACFFHFQCYFDIVILNARPSKEKLSKTQKFHNPWIIHDPMVPEILRIHFQDIFSGRPASFFSNCTEPALPITYYRAACFSLAL